MYWQGNLPGKGSPACWSLFRERIRLIEDLRAHARKYSGAAKTHTAEQHGRPQRGSRGSSHNQGPAVACDLLLAS